MKLITLLTDFTAKDGYPGMMKGVILTIAPDATVMDLSHDIPPQDVRQAALLLNRSIPFFPSGSVHVCVVDPGVGTDRRGIIAQLSSQVFISPDNGLLTLVYQRAAKAGGPLDVYTLENPEYMLHPVSRTFHGRDIFAPAAAHLVNGSPIESFGRSISQPVLMDLPEAKRTTNGWQGEVISIDAFGNLACNLDKSHLSHPETIKIRIKEQEIDGLVTTFADRQPGELAAMLDSFGSLSISVVNGSAKERLHASVGDPVQIIKG